MFQEIDYDIIPDSKKPLDDEWEFDDEEYEE